MVDDDALTYLQKEYGTIRLNQLKLFRDVADGIESAAGEMQDRQISIKKVKYINEALQEGVSKNKI